MDAFQPSDVPLPAFLDPLLDYLSSLLPPPVYTFALTFLSHSLALISALISLVKTLISSQPWKWDAQQVIPPLITVLAAYLALLSFYRTTSWMIRSSMWLVKWGAITAALLSGAAWYNGIGKNGLTSALGGFALDFINGNGLNAAGGQRARANTKAKSKPWEPFEHQKKKGTERDANPDYENIIQDIVGEGWWNIAKNVYNQVADFAKYEVPETQTGGSRSGKQKKTKTKATRSR